MISKKMFFTGMLAALTAISCGKSESAAPTHGMAMATTSETTSPDAYKVGDIVPNHLVCMVNNEYMGGKEQLVMDFDGKTYYGCCEMCQERIPVDESVRTAVDPYSNKVVDKSLAVIVIAGPNGEVAYFENEDNYKKFLEEI